jgi:hypothetical protein
MTSYFDLGQYSRPVTTESADAQAWFDRGLIWCYGYNHEEAVSCFRKAAEYDPSCAMAYWGVSYAVGPNYNKQWKAFDPIDLKRSLSAAHDAARQALALVDSASAVEQALIRPLAQRYPSNDADKVTPIWNDEYANRMRETYRAHQDDHDVAALFGEAIMNRTPWSRLANRQRVPIRWRPSPSSNWPWRNRAACTIRACFTCTFTSWKCRPARRKPSGQRTRCATSFPMLAI